jgi:hypothetical protein
MIVRLRKDIISSVMWGSWGDTSSVVGRMHEGEVATVIESNEYKGGNGVRIITSAGITGWTYNSSLMEIK